MTYRIVTDQQYSQFMTDVAHSGLPADATVIYSGRNRVAYVDRNGERLNIKAFRLPRFPNNYVYRRFRKSKAERSYENGCRLLELGFHTPRPIGFAEERDMLRLYRSYYVSEQITALDIRDIELSPERVPVLEALGRELWRLHRAGVLMKDFSPGNILYNRNADGSYTFLYVDLNRMEFGVHSRNKLYRMFRSIVWGPEELAIIARSYAVAAGTDPDNTARRAIAEQARFQRRLKRKAALKQRLRK